MDRPLLLLDIDGVISLFGFDPARRPEGQFLTVDGIPHFVSAQAAEHVLALAHDYELTWCSGWEEKADEHLPFALGLPSGLPHVAFPAPTQSSAGHWKLAAIDEFAGPARSLAWVDDAHDESCHAWAATRSAPTLLVATDPAIGLTGEHRQQLAVWARGLTGS
jgi:hypothetical protein